MLIAALFFSLEKQTPAVTLKSDKPLENKIT